MDEVQRLSGQLSEALNQAAAQDLELRKVRRALEQAESEAADVTKAKEQLTLEREKLAADLTAAQAAKARADTELADLSSRLLEDAGERVREANMRAAEAEQRAKEVEARRARQIAQMEESHAQQIAVLQAMIMAGAESGPSTPSNKQDVYLTHIPSFGTREVDLGDDDDFAEALEAAQWTSPLRPTARTDLQDYKDFIELANTSAALTQSSQSGILAPFQRSSTPRMPHLTSIRFAARTIAEDVEPTLRLDSAVHLSWLVRRAWYQAVVDGTLVIEPVDAKLKAWATRPSNPCCLCGESRTTPQYARLYRVKLPRDQDNYILGLECVVRVRSACEYIAFLRSLRDGVRKVSTPEAALSAWQECLKLREEMFWSRSSGFYAMERDAVDRAYVPPTPRVTESPSIVPENLDTRKVPEISGARLDPNPAAAAAGPSTGQTEQTARTLRSPPKLGSEGGFDALKISHGSEAASAKGISSQPTNAQSSAEASPRIRKSPAGSGSEEIMPPNDDDENSDSSTSMRSARSSPSV